MRRGLSILELLISMGLLATIMTVIYSLLVPGLRVWSRSNERSELQQNGIVAVAHLCLDATASTDDSLLISTATYADATTGVPLEKDALSFYSPYDAAGAVDYSPLGAVLWQKTIAYYLDETRGELCRQEFPLAGATSDPTHPLAPAIDRAAPHQVIARDVTTVAFTAQQTHSTDGRTLFGNPLTVRIAFKTQHETNAIETAVQLMYTHD